MFVKASWRIWGPIISSTPRKSLVCGAACGAWNLTVGVCWHTCLQTHIDAVPHAHKHTLELVIGLMKPGQDQQKLSPVFVKVCVCVCVCASGFLWLSSNALACSRPPKTRQFPAKPSECDCSRCLMGKGWETGHYQNPGNSIVLILRISSFNSQHASSFKSYFLTENGSSTWREYSGNMWSDGEEFYSLF